MLQARHTRPTGPRRSTLQTTLYSHPTPCSSSPVSTRGIHRSQNASGRRVGVLSSHVTSTARAPPPAGALRGMGEGKLKSGG